MSRDRSQARRARLRRLIVERAVSNQEEAVRMLAGSGHRVTQATVSRDLTAIGARKHVGPDGGERYVLGQADPATDGSAKLSRMMREFVVSVAHSGNLALLKTAPGSAGPVATALDRARPADMLGTVAGDDTVLVVARGARGGAGLARRLETILEGGSR